MHLFCARRGLIDKLRGVLGLPEATVVWMVVCTGLSPASHCAGDMSNTSILLGVAVSELEMCMVGFLEKLIAWMRVSCCGLLLHDPSDLLLGLVFGISAGSILCSGVVASRVEQPEEDLEP